MIYTYIHIYIHIHICIYWVAWISLTKNINNIYPRDHHYEPALGNITKEHRIIQSFPKKQQRPTTIKIP